MQFGSAVEMNVEKKSSEEVLIAGLDMPVIVDLSITNFGESDNFGFYNLVGFQTFPKDKIYIGTNETKDVMLMFSPIGEIKHRGYYTISYYIRGEKGYEQKEKLTFRIINLQDAFEINSVEFNPESNSVEIYLDNKVNHQFENVHAKFTSAFFNFEEDFSLGPYKRKDFSIEINKEDSKKLLAGFYTMKVQIQVENETAELEKAIKFAEKSWIETKDRDYGLIVNTRIISKENKGNVVTNSEVSLRKNIISRLFTTFNIEPNVERKGTEIIYTWNLEIKPGETEEVIVKTNWFFPLLIVGLILIIVILAKQYTLTDISLRKRVSFVKTKGGEFALKVSIFVQANKNVENVNIIDRFPNLVQLHHRFGGDEPSRINEKAKKIEWNFKSLEAGEKRFFSYIIYSKVGVLGKFALPITKAIYEKEGDIHESSSNRTFFVAEPRKEDLE